MKILAVLIALMPTPAMAEFCWHTVGEARIIVTPTMAVHSRGGAAETCPVIGRHVKDDMTIASFQCNGFTPSFVSIDGVVFWDGRMTERVCGTSREEEPAL